MAESRDIAIIVLTRLRQQPRRTLLAASGVAIGAATLMFLVNLTHGVAAAAATGLTSIGARSLAIVSRQPAGSGAREPLPLTFDDAAALARSGTLLSRVSPIIRFQAAVQGCRGRATARIVGVVPEQMRLRRHALASGRQLTEYDDLRRRATCVLGSSLARRLGCGGTPGATVTFGGTTCTIVGTLGRGERGALEEDALLTPASFLVRTVGRRLEGSISMSAEVRPDATLDAAVQQIRGILSRRHRIEEGEEPDFAVNRQQDVGEGLKRLTGSTTGIITAVALWSLVIACAGIMNAVLNSVLERISHIGLQRAVGARRADIRLEFLVEGGAIATTGALLGIALGSAAAAIVSAALDLPQQFDIDAASVALGMSLLLGIAAATWPASHAARLDPAAALRAE